MIFVLAFSTLVFRSEVLILAGSIALVLLVQRKISIFQLLYYGLSFGMISIGLSIAVDSYFWKRLIWPELEVFFFNTYHNKSHEWGVSPYYWYFLVAIPKVLTTTIIPFFFGIYADMTNHVSPYSTNSKSTTTLYSKVDRKRVTLNYLFPIVLFLAIYSVLPHKELRFIFYVFPIINLVSAIGLDWMMSPTLVKLKSDEDEKKNKQNSSQSAASTSTKFGTLVVVGVLLSSFVVSCGMLYISSLNYPGGVAFKSLHNLENANEQVEVHISVLAAMTGISRFGELNPNWKYHKTENIESTEEYLRYTHLITDDQQFIKNTTHWQIISEIGGYSGIKKSFPPAVLTEPTLYVLKRKQ
eukprot:TRINITY_DN4376_c0_g1_i3.p1 TRINITY_DN4376_c0_g1~~TRINITY_DN4376_c0_g1_i3.p1  ORF type:complete len:355 (-),score=83.92 TRINITY_DN4376_c0_g1_i3:162-1226(-)